MSMIDSAKRAISLRSRKQKLDHFYSVCEPSSRVLDVGVSGSDRLEHVNIFLKTFRFDEKQYTGLAVSSMEEISSQYPTKRLVQYAGGVFPFKPNSFDWVFSNAVIEHVGDDQDQLLFMNEMLRVSRNVFFTTPNKYFPIESHANTLFRHWFGRSFYKWCSKKELFWNPKNLNLLSYRGLDDLMKRCDAKSYSIRKNRAMGWPMTFTVVCSR